ncbi:dual specificity protein phosphatase family protein [Haloarchaeobius sp. TZWWS8]|uniref:dual specificity protein phosphatase family protein n=1 Tax=Haloarchaeobius sp. TZWWS8 TaxID=3446121 RepID=UPI003EBE2EB0
MQSDQTVYVRPLGYVEDSPVARRVGDREVFIGNVHAPTSGREFETVVSLTDAQPTTTDHHPLVDGPEADFSTFAAAVDATRARMRADGSVLVHCRAGVSRSSAVLAAALATEQETSFVDELHRVQQARPTAVPHPALHELGVVYVAAHG